MSPLIEATYRESYRHGFLIYQICSLLTLLGLLVAVVAVDGVGWFFLLILPVFLIASARVSIALYRAYVRQTELSVDEHGLRLRSFQAVPWSAIKSAKTVSMAGKQYLKLSINQRLVNYAGALDRMLAHFWNRPNSVTWIREDEYACDWAKLLDTVSRFCPTFTRS